MFVKLGRFYSWSVEIATRSCFASARDEPEELCEAKFKEEFKHSIHHGDTEYTEMHGEP